MKYLNTKTLTILFIATAILGACQQKKENGKIDTDVINNPISADGTKSDKIPNLKFGIESHDFGTMKQGEKKSFEFEFENIGGADLIIEDAKGSCGCTVPQYPKKPIAAGEKGVIIVTFNSEGKHGIQNKSVTLITNCIPSTRFLAIKANVLAEK